MCHRRPGSHENPLALSWPSFHRCHVLLLLGPEGRLHGVDDLRVGPHATNIDKPLGPNDVRVRVSFGRQQREWRGTTHNAKSSTHAVCGRETIDSASLNAGGLDDWPRRGLLRFMVLAGTRQLHTNVSSDRFRVDLDKPKHSLC